MTILDEIQQLIRRLTRFEREQLAEWILTGADFDDRVGEAAADYAKSLEGQYLTVEEYLRMEEASPLRHEYVAGQIFAMSGATLRHKAIIDSLLLSVAPQLRGGPCRALSDGVKLRLRLDREEIFYYPDFMVACGPQEMSSYFVATPRLVVEVLSPSTELIDRREKALNYRGVPSLEEFALVAQRSQEVTLYRRSEDWSPITLRGPDAVVEFRSIGLTLPLERIYEGTGV